MEVSKVKGVSGYTYYISCVKAASEIFGMPIKDAKIVFAKDAKEDLMVKAEELADHIDTLYRKSGNLWFDNKELIIELENGHQISMMGSEWASVRNS